MQDINSSGLEKKASKTVFVVMVITLFARVFGLLREVLIAGYYGTTIYTDAYIIANNIPTVLFDTLGQAVLTTFIPMYAKAKQEEDESRANKFTIHLLSCLMIICLILTLFCEIFAKQVVFIFASGFEGEALKITIMFTRILLPSLFAMTLVKLFTGYLQMYQRFILSTFVTVIGNLMIIFSLVISNFFDNVYIFVWGSLFGLLAQVIFLLPSIVNLGLFKENTKFFQYDKYVHMLVPLLIPVCIGSALNEINSIIDRTIISVIVTPIITYMYPKFSDLGAQGRLKEYKENIHYCMNVILSVIIPTAIIVFGFRGTIVKILFERGSFDTVATIKTTSALAYYTIGLVAMAVQQVLIRAFYSLQNTFTPMVNGVICALVNICLDYVLIKQYGVIGAALATSIVAILACFILVILLRIKKIISLKVVGILLAKNGISGVIMAIFLVIVYVNLLKEISFGIVYVFIVCGVILSAGFLYLLTQKIVRNDEVVNGMIELLHRNKKQQA